MWILTQRILHITSAKRFGYFRYFASFDVAVCPVYKIKLPERFRKNKVVFLFGTTYCSYEHAFGGKLKENA